MDKNLAIAKFSAYKNKFEDGTLLREAIQLVEDITAKELYRRYGKDTIQQKFSGTGMFENISPENENVSISLLNNKLSMLLLSKAYYDYCGVELQFDENTYEPKTDVVKNIIKNPQLWKDPVFISRFAAIYEEAISPAVQSLAIGFYDNLVQIHNIGWGDSLAITVDSNEVLVVDEIAQDTLRVARQRLLSEEYTANPRPYGAAVSVNFYHLASGKVNWAEHIYAIARAFVKKWNLMSINVLKKTIDDAMLAGGGETPYFLATFSDENHTRLISLLEAANDAYTVNVYGDIQALNVLLPAEGSDKQATEWGEKGFVTAYKGANIYKLRQTLIPGTINSDPVFGAPENYLWYLTESVKPIHLVFEGERLQIDRSSFETGDGTVTFKLISNFDMIYVPATKIGCIVVK